MFDWKSPAEWKRVWRYYQAGIVNTLFGYGLFAVMVALGMNMYLAQIASHLMGMTFNYFTYSRYAFADRSASKYRFVLSYALNYLIGVALLALLSRAFPSPYVAGLLSTILVSAINYLFLRNLVFRETGR